MSCTLVNAASIVYRLWVKSWISLDLCALPLGLGDPLRLFICRLKMFSCREHGMMPTERACWTLRLWNRATVRIQNLVTRFSLGLNLMHWTLRRSCPGSTRIFRFLTTFLREETMHIPIWKQSRSTSAGAPCCPGLTRSARSVYVSTGKLQNKDCLTNFFYDSVSFLNTPSVP